MTLNEDQLAALDALKFASSYDQPLDKYASDYTIAQVDSYLGQSVNGILHWLAIRNHITAPDFEERKRAAEAERLAKIVEFSEKNRDKLMRSWIMNLANTASKAYPDGEINIVSNDEITSLKASGNGNLWNISILYSKEDKELRTFVRGLSDYLIKESITTVHGSTSPYTAFKGFAAVKEHFDKKIAGLDS